jgi:hypothetical protein
MTIPILCRCSGCRRPDSTGVEALPFKWRLQLFGIACTVPDAGSVLGRSGYDPFWSFHHQKHLQTMPSRRDLN